MTEFNAGFEIMKKWRKIEFLLIVALLSVFTVACGNNNKVSGNVTSSGSAMQGVTMTLSDASSVSPTTTTDVNGNFSFNVNSNGSYTLTPSMSGYTFTPASITITINNADSAGNNFAAGTAVKVQMGGAIQGNPLNLTPVVSTTAGTAGSVGFIDGTGPAARFSSPEGITTDGTSLYVADTGSSTIRRIATFTRVVSTPAGLAGSIGIADGTGAMARFNSPEGITTDGTSLFIADIRNNTIRKTQ